MKIRQRSIQRITIADMIDFEFIGAGCLLSIDVKAGIVRDLLCSLEHHLIPLGADAALPLAFERSVAEQRANDESS